MFVVLRVLVEPGVCFDSSDRVLVPDEVGELIWPSFRVIVFADRCLRVAVLAVAGYACGGWSSSDPRLLGCVAWLAGWSLAVDLPRAPFGSSVPPFLAVVLLVAGIGLVAVVLMCGGCVGGGGLPKGLRVLCCTSRLVEWNSFVGVPRGSPGSSVSLSSALHLIVVTVLDLARMWLGQTC